MVLHATRRLITSVSAGIILLAGPALQPLLAQNAPETQKPQGVTAKIQPMLNRAVSLTRNGLSAQSLAGPMMKLTESGQVQVYVHMAETSDAAISRLKSLGLKIDLLNDELKVAQGWLSLSSIETVAGLDVVKQITLPSYARKREGAVTTEGYEILLVNKARNGGARGQGTKIGLISDGMDHRAAAQATGDLPPSIQIDPSLPGSGDAGTALLEIVYDLAPDAALAFSGPATSLEFISSLNYLATTANCDIVFDDMGFYDEPVFEDGPVANAVKIAAASTVYLTAAGNDNGLHFQGNYVDVVPNAGGWPNNLHSFGGTDVSQQVVIDPGTQVVVFLHWNNLFGQAADDYDLYLYDDPPTTELAGSAARQNGSGDPYEALIYTNSKSTPITANILINRFTGSARTLEVFVWNATSMQFATPADSIFGHPTLPEVLSVGANNAAMPTLIAPYSSRGPSSLSFPISTRQTPSFVTVDGVSITGAGNYPTTFYGTSAAAAHAAAIAALTINGHPTFTPTQIRNIMKSTATDLGTPGYDNVYGSGLLNAQKAVGLTETGVKQWLVFR